MSRPSKTRWFWAAAVAVLCAAVLAPVVAGPASAAPLAVGEYRVTQTVTTGAGGLGAAFDPATGLVYVANQADHSISVFDGATGVAAAFSPIHTINEVVGVAVDDADGLLFSTNWLSPSVSVYDLATGVEASFSPIATGLFPDQIAIDPTSDLVYVTNATGNTVSVFHGATGVAASFSPVTVGTNPVGLVIDPATHLVFVGNYGSSNVSVFDAATGVAASFSPVQVGDGPDGVEIDPTTDQVWVPTWNDGSVSVFDAATGAPASFSPLHGTNAGAPNFARYDPATGQMLVSNHDSGDVSVFDAATGVEAANSPIPAVPSAGQLVLNPLTDTVFVAGDGATAVLSFTPAITSTSLPVTTQGAVFSYSVPATGSLPRTFGVTAGALPAGLALNSTTGVISGTPSAAAPYSFELTITNVAGPFAQTFTGSVVVAPGPPTLDLSSAVVGSPFSGTVTATGTGPFTFAVSAGTLPAGLTLDTSTGVVSGTPTTAGPYSFEITVTGPGGTSSQTFTGSLSIPPGTPVVDLSAARVGSPIAVTAAVTGTGPFTFAVSTGTLPAGLTVDPATGVISGTPTTAGPYSFQLTVTGPGGTSSLTVTGAVAAAPTLGAPLVGSALSVTVPTDGTGPFTFAVTTGVLPAGLTLDPVTGVISGTPTTAGPYSFQVSVTNSAGTSVMTYTGAVDALTLVAVDSTPLAQTGTDVLDLVAGGLSVLLIGLLMLITARRRAGGTPEELG